MGESTASLKQLAARSRRFARRLLVIGENRLELLTVEMQEQRERLLRTLLLALAVAVFGLLASVTLTAVVWCGCGTFRPWPCCSWKNSQNHCKQMAEGVGFVRVNGIICKRSKRVFPFIQA